MALLRSSTVATVATVLWGCGPEIVADAYPNNCGVEGPVDLFGVFPGGYVEVQRVGGHYLVDHSWDLETLETYSVDRCGRERTLLQRAELDTPIRLAAGGDHALSCNEDTGEMDYLDPTGVEPPRPLFPGPVEDCRVVPLGRGLAAQQWEGGTVWFHPDPADPSLDPIVVTDAARLPSPSSYACWPRFDCDLPLEQLYIRAAGDDLLVPMESEKLVAFSSRTLASRRLDEGPVHAIDVLTGKDHVVVSRRLEPDLVVDRRTGTAVEFCCYDDIYPIRRFGDWLVKGSPDSPVFPEPPEWINFRALHLPSGHHTEVMGTDAWHMVAPLTADTIVVDIGPPWHPEEGARYVVWPATGERRRVELPGELAWVTPGVDGVFTTKDDLSSYGLHHLAGPDQPPRTLLRDVTIAFPTVHGRIVFERGMREGREPLPLSVMLPDERIVDLDERVVATMSPSPWDERWMSDADEVVYVAEDDEGHWMLRRTVLP